MVSDLVKLELVTDMHMLLAKSFEDALRRAHAIEGRNAKATVLPDGLAWSLHMELAKTVEADMHMELAQTFSTGPVPAGHPARAVGPRAIHRGNPRRRPGVLSRFITLLESQLAADRGRAPRVLTVRLTHSGRSIRVGITGVPGAGKSTPIESLGLRLQLLAAKLANLYPGDEEPDAP